MPCNYALYPKNWLTEIRPAILRRAGATDDIGTGAKCEECGAPYRAFALRLSDGQPREIRVILTIAHLDQDITNNDPENLAALCQKCHLKWDRPFHIINAGLTRDRKKQQALLPGIQPEEWRIHAMAKTNGHSFNVIMDAEEMGMLADLAASTRTNMSTVLRQALRYRHAMTHANVPTCADGRACFVPHMHVQPAQPKGTTTP